MKTLSTLNKTLIALAVGSMLATSANAAVNYGNMGQAYVGAKVGQFDTDTSNTDIEESTAYGLYAGYDFGQGFGVEGEYLTSADISLSDDEDDTANDSDITTSTLGAYTTYRYNLPNTGIYAKGKLGFAQLNFDLNGSEIEESGFAGGLGLGMNISPNFSIEGEYNMLPSIESDLADVDTNLMSLGAHLKF